MKKSQILMSLLLVILLSSCYASRITYENLSIIQRGMSSKEVIAIMGKPSYRSFDEESEMLEFRTSESSIAGVVNIWFVDDRVTKMKSYYTNAFAPVFKIVSASTSESISASMTPIFKSSFSASIALGMLK